MALYICLLVVLTLLAQGHGNDLHWPPEYTVKATKISLTSNLIEDLQLWKSDTDARVDYNDGAVKYIEKYDKSLSLPRTYYIRPTTFPNETVHDDCAVYQGFYKYLYRLPSTNGFICDGQDEVRGENTTKYKYGYTKNGNRHNDTLWAIYNSSQDYWYPVRHESLKFNIELGYKANHVITDYYGFSTNFSKEEIFNLNDYDCQKVNKKVTMDTDVVTKELVFIDPENDDHVDHVFNTFKDSYEKKYADDKEHAFRKRIFQNNMRHIAVTNKNNLGYKLAINKFADRTPEELKDHLGFRQRAAEKTGNVPFPYTQRQLTELSKDLPKEYDLRLYGFVSTVKDQGQCISDITFAATAAVEGALAKSNGGRLQSLANQALIDCAWEGFESYGCYGGTVIGAYEWMMKYGLPTEAEYGLYKNREGVCHIKNMTKLYPIRGYTAVTRLSVEATKIALINHGPLVVTVPVSPDYTMYSSGIFYDISCKKTDSMHYMTLVGYGERYGETFWILKNALGPNWGIDGYMHMSAKENVCFTTEPTYVVV